MLERKSPFVCSVNGAKEISIENYGSLGDFSDKKIVLNCYKCKMPDCFKWDESGTFFKSLRSKADSFVEY